MTEAAQPGEATPDRPVPGAALGADASLAVGPEGAALAEAVRAEHLRAAYEQLPVALAANVVISGILVALYWGVVAPTALLAWWVAMLTQCGVRIWIRARYLQSRPAPHEVEPWIRALVVGAAVAGTLWGVAGWMLFTGAVERQLVICFVLGGMAAGATTSLAGVPRAFWAYLVPSLIPLALRMLLSGGARTLAMGLMTLAFMAGVGLIATNLYRSVSRAHAYRFRNEWLASELAGAREKLSAANDQLEERVRQRTEELERMQRVQRETERELLHAQRLEALGQLTRGVAHDFNNLLTIVTSSLELLAAPDRRTADDPALVAHALSAASRGAELTRSLIAFSRTQQLRPRTFDANALVQRTVDELLARALGARVRIETLLAPDLWPVHADPLQLETALLNLAINARDAMPGGGTLTISTCNVSAAEVARRPRTPDMAGLAPEKDVRDLVQIRVRDTGCGIPPDLEHRVFEPFFSTKEAGQGSGLGLSMVYGFVRQSGGAVRLSSRQAEGCEVVLELPRGQGRPSPLAAEAHRPPTRHRLPHGESILVVEDDPHVRELTVRMVRRFGYQPLAASDAEAALALIRTDSSIDMLLSDVLMPGGTDGGKLAQLAVAVRPDLRVLLVSGYTEPVASAPDGTAWPILHKPYTAAQLEAAIRDTLYGDSGEPTDSG